MANKKKKAPICDKISTRSSSQESTLEDIFDHVNPTNLDIINAIRKMYEELKHSITFNGHIMEQMKQNIQSLSNENKALKKDHEQLKTRVAELEHEVIHVRNSNREMAKIKSKNVVILGLNGDENSKTDVTKTFAAMNINLPQDDFSVRVLPSKNATKPILVTLANEELKNKILEQRKTIPLDTEICGILSDNKRKIYVNPDLTKHTRDLFLKAKELKRCGFTYVWCKNDNVLVRKNDRDPVIRIITAAQVEGMKK